MPIASDAVVRAIDTQKQTEERFQYLENTIAQLGRMVNAYSSAIADALKEGKTSIDVIKISERLATNFIDETEHDH